MLRVRISLEQSCSTPLANLKLVQTAGRELRNEELPDARISEHLHLMRVSVPAVEITNDAYTGSLRRPNGKRDAFRATYFRDVRAEFFVDLFVATLAEEMEIDVAQKTHNADERGLEDAD